MNAVFSTLHPDPARQGVRIDRAKYDMMRNAVLDVLKICGPMRFKELSAAVGDRLAGKFEGSILWYFTTVKLDLEARGMIRRVPKSKPQMIELV